MSAKWLLTGGLTIFPCAAAALSAAQPQIYTYSIGTGFFIHRDGYVVTNHHVIDQCEEITLHGAVPDSPAELVAVHKGYDLALLKSKAIPMAFASLNNDKQPVQAGSRVVVVGYPGQSWEAGEPVTREAKIKQVEDIGGEDKWLVFSSSLEEGNSGGPLLDDSGNVVGVVAAKASVYKTPEKKELKEEVDLAISLPVLRSFLSASGIVFQQADSGIYHGATYLTDHARKYIVNVRCKYTGKQ